MYISPAKSFDRCMYCQKHSACLQKLTTALTLAPNDVTRARWHSISIICRSEDLLAIFI